VPGGETVDNWKLKMAEELEKVNPKPGSLVYAAIRHDSWCLRLRGKGPCNCNPEIEIFEDLTPDQWIASMMGVDRST
jgi:hypothetical protein